MRTRFSKPTAGQPSQRHQLLISQVANASSPPPFQFLDTRYVAGTTTQAPTDPIRLLFLSAYYCLATPQTY